ncbi:MAG: LPS export ABC transporter permease LptF [Alphaproteobacteria bacterium]|nr:LPS export ABC transporter permease LptF [Alphaproteobacteria bacterium]
MHEYSRYIIRCLMGPLVFITLTLTGVIWLSQSLRFIDLIINKGLSAGTFFYLTMLLLPALLAIVLPVALFCAVLYVYNKLTMDSELVVLESAGLSRLALAAPALLVSAGVAVAGYAISLYLLPVTYREFKNMQSFIRNNYASLLLQEGVFNSPVDRLTVYIRSRDRDGTLRGILVHDARVPSRPSTMMAQEGQLIKGENGPRFVLRNGNRQEVSQKDRQLSLLNFERYDLDISLYAGNLESRTPEPEERFVSELLAGDPNKPEINQRLLAEAHQRLTWPLYGPAVALFGIGVLFSGQFSRRGQWKRLSAASLFAVGGMAAALAWRTMAAKYMIFIPVIYLNLLVMFGLGAWLLWRGQAGGRVQIPNGAPA